MFVSTPYEYFSYSPVGDILVLAIIMIFAVLIKTAQIRTSQDLRVFTLILAILSVASCAHIIFHQLLYNINRNTLLLIYFLYFAYHFLLFFDIALYLLYIERITWLSSGRNRSIFKRALVGVVIFSALEMVTTISKVGFYITEDYQVIQGINVTSIEYVLYVGVVVISIIGYKDRVYKPIIMGFIFTIGISLVVMYIQEIHRQMSFTTATFLFPAFSVLYYLHSNSFNPETGVLPLESFEKTFETFTKGKEGVLILSLFLHEFEDPGKKYTKGFRDFIRMYANNFFKGSTAFQISNGRFMLIADMEKNQDYKKATDKILEVFRGQYSVYKHDFKIVITRSYESFTEPEMYIKLIKYAEGMMQENEIKYIDDEFFEGFNKYVYVLKQLADIDEKKNPEDERVLVFCQPVYNLRNGRFDTAEALMRLQLDETGMVFPNEFIPIAEESNYINTLSLIILSKTCKAVRKFLDEGYDVQRVSVNFSMLDLKSEQFSNNVKRIISDSRTPFDKIAMEIKEIQNEKDFLIVKERMNELKESGIMFYLDDFGTGYSSFERIMELPFDIIKFDRSTVIASRNSTRSQTMLSSMAQMFKNMNYSALFEGIEDDHDEELCSNMNAGYLQGFKYSKPIPIEDLTEYFAKA
ncbi:MAG: EAL domain-containing protein [Butyrivibrio sp.]|nr:EAL domain-containing protein [Butyrivibrio sp.]